ncbi:hypothetical protein KJ765_02225 [Candidatus Micrarchaeota archaeon]|nr:hypothetical protein [Candidatus Micrarchaeota archaeon]
MKYVAALVVLALAISMASAIVVSINTPQSGEAWNTGDVVSISWSSVKPKFSVFWCSNTAICDSFPEDFYAVEGCTGITDYSCSWDTTGFDEGPYTLAVQGYEIAEPYEGDGEGQGGEYPISGLQYSLVTPVYLDDTAPDTSIVYGFPNYYEEPNQFISSSTPLTLEVDDVSGAQASYWNSGEACETVEPDDWNEYSAAFYLENAGCQTVCYFSVDMADNVEVPKESTACVDHLPPITAIDAPGSPFLEDEEISFSAEDQGSPASGVAAIYYRVDEGEWRTYSIPFTLEEYISGWHDLEFYSVDNVGNEESHWYEAYQTMGHLDHYFIDAPESTLVYAIFDVIVYAQNDEDQTVEDFNGMATLSINVQTPAALYLNTVQELETDLEFIDGVAMFTIKYNDIGLIDMHAEDEDEISGDAETLSFNPPQEPTPPPGGGGSNGGTGDPFLRPSATPEPEELVITGTPEPTPEVTPEPTTAPVEDEGTAGQPSATPTATPIATATPIPTEEATASPEPQPSSATGLFTANLQPLWGAFIVIILALLYAFRSSWLPLAGMNGKKGK